jgi:hypothetical protein
VCVAFASDEQRWAVHNFSKQRRYEMTCTIHYSLSLKARTTADAEKSLEHLRQRALALPFKAVSGMYDLRAEEWQSIFDDNSDPRYKVAIRASLDPDQIERFKTAPKRILAFVVTVGDGCEEAVFGLRKWGSQESNLPKYDSDAWGWHAFSKTFFATRVSDQHFLRCHLSLIRLLEHAQELRILGTVKDDGSYWESRDWAGLAQQVGCVRTDALFLYAATIEDLLWQNRTR